MSILKITFCLDCGICEGRDEEESSAGAGCDWFTVVLPHECCGMEQEGRAGHWAGPQTSEGIVLIYFTVAEVEQPSQKSRLQVHTIKYTYVKFKLRILSTNNH